ncbi:MAG: Trk system potassium transporter TrkA [Rhodothermales bacterium]
MRAIVVGAGEVGFEVARILAMENHDVIVVDTDAESLAPVAERLDVLTVQGSGTSAELLEQIGVREAKIVVAVTAIDEVNIICCMLAERLGHDVTTIARIRSATLTKEHPALNAADFGINLIIQPEVSAADEVVQLIRRASATDVLTFADDRLHLVGMRIDPGSEAIDVPLEDIAAAHPEVAFQVMAVGRGIRTILPRGSERLRAGDQVFILSRPKYLQPILRFMGKGEAKIQHVMILGGGTLGQRVAQQLSAKKAMRVKLIESDTATAEDLACALPDVLVLNGDPTDIDLLVREGLSEMDALVAVTENEESNLVACLMAKHLEVRKTVGLLSKGAYIPISQSIGLDAAVSKKLAVSREILRFLRGKSVRNCATIHGIDTEVLEMTAQPRSAITKRSLEKLKLPSGILIGAVLHGKQVELASGETHIEPGDRAIVFALPGFVTKAERLFER